MWFDLDSKKKRSARNMPKPVPIVNGPSTATIQRAQSNPMMMQPQDVLQLQRTIGNQAVSSMLHRSPTHQHTSTPSNTIQRTPDIQRAPQNSQPKKRGLLNRLKGLFSKNKKTPQEQSVPWSAARSTGNRSQNRIKIGKGALTAIPSLPVQQMVTASGSQPVAPEQRVYQQKNIVPTRTPITPEFEQKVADSFAGSKFLYGTTGGGSYVGKYVKNFTDKVAEPYWAGRRNLEASGPYSGPSTPHPWKLKTNQTRPLKREANFYEPGPRVLHGDEHQMMDYYYGQNNDLHLRRDPIIGEYIHKMMGYVGDYDHNKPGWESWLNTYNQAYSVDQQKAERTDGWLSMQKPDPTNPGKTVNADIFKHPQTGKPLTGTKEISRLVREGIHKYGGTLIFEGKNVNWESVFGGGFIADTTEEAIGLMPYFAAHPGQAVVPFGKGTLIFHWGGKQVAPSQAHFRQNWYYKTDSNKKSIFHQPENRLNLPHDHMTDPKEKQRLEDEFTAQKQKMANFDLMQDHNPNGSQNYFHSFPQLPVEKPKDLLSVKQFERDYNRKPDKNDKLGQRKKGDVFLWMLQELRKQKAKDGTVL